MKEKCGVIYILTNPSFPEYIKIGYADNVEERVKEIANMLSGATLTEAALNNAKALISG